MNVLDDVLNRRLINTLRDQVSKVLSHMLFEDINTDKCVDEVSSIVNNLLNSMYQGSIIDDYSISEPSLPIGKKLTSIIRINNGRRRPVYVANIILSCSDTYTIKTSRSLRAAKTALKKFDTTGFFVCDINIKPIEAPEFITLKIKVNRNA